MVFDTRAPRLADPAGMDSAKTASKMVGSTSAAMVISRLAPMPPNEVPVSMPARVNATVPTNSSPTTANKSALESSGDPVATSGAIAAISNVDPATMAGAAANTTVVPTRGDLLFAKLFDYIAPRLQDAATGAALPACAHLPGKADHQRRPGHHGADLHRARDVGEHVHRATTSTTSTPSAP